MGNKQSANIYSLFEDSFRFKTPVNFTISAFHELAAAEIIYRANPRKSVGIFNSLVVTIWECAVFKVGHRQVAQARELLSNTALLGELREAQYLRLICTARDAAESRSLPNTNRRALN